uniref:Uncharacterized mitochondrial protein AtMg00810-like n=1 Tax=Tanacetum cinerariifolium TaxID=118510 RepID=A0A6L2LRB3_TANCI|nr:uncharacterized mitochondrial protein AtMg00810-like [Tanacetum cinerariifolium]
MLGGKLVCWSSKKQQSVAMSSAEAEYVAAAGCCANILWMKIQLRDYGIEYKMVPIFCDNTSAIAISNNPTSDTPETTKPKKKEPTLGTDKSQSVSKGQHTDPSVPGARTSSGFGLPFSHPHDGTRKSQLLPGGTEHSKDPLGGQQPDGRSTKHSTRSGLGKSQPKPKEQQTSPNVSEERTTSEFGPRLTNIPDERTLHQQSLSKGQVTFPKDSEGSPLMGSQPADREGTFTVTDHSPQTELHDKRDKTQSSFESSGSGLKEGKLSFEGELEKLAPPQTSQAIFTFLEDTDDSKDEEFMAMGDEELLEAGDEIDMIEPFEAPPQPHNDQPKDGTSPFLDEESTSLEVSKTKPSPEASLKSSPEATLKPSPEATTKPSAEATHSGEKSMTRWVIESSPQQLSSTGQSLDDLFRDYDDVKPVTKKVLGKTFRGAFQGLYTSVIREVEKKYTQLKEQSTDFSADLNTYITLQHDENEIVKGLLNEHLDVIDKINADHTSQRLQLINIVTQAQTAISEMNTLKDPIHHAMSSSTDSMKKISELVAHITEVKLPEFQDKLAAQQVLFEEIKQKCNTIAQAVKHDTEAEAQMYEAGQRVLKNLELLEDISKQLHASEIPLLKTRIESLETSQTVLLHQVNKIGNDTENMKMMVTEMFKVFKQAQAEQAQADQAEADHAKETRKPSGSSKRPKVIIVDEIPPPKSPKSRMATFGWEKAGAKLFTWEEPSQPAGESKDEVQTAEPIMTSEEQSQRQSTITSQILSSGSMTNIRSILNF